MSVHYKFKSAVEYDTLPVDGVSISLEDLKEAIIQQKRLGRGQPYDLQITNAETKEVYTNDKTLIPKNSSLIVARVPIDPGLMKKSWDPKDSTTLLLSNPSNLMNTEDAAEAAQIDRKIKELTDLTRMDGSEDDKINAMVAQSTMAYHPSKYAKIRVSKMIGTVPLDYKCYKCHQSGHWVNMCPLNHQDLRKSTGIPSKFLVEVSDPSIPGVMINSSGKFVRLLDMEETSQEKQLPPPDRIPPPQDIVCLLCKELLRDAVLIPCCAAAFCDDCIRPHLVESEEMKCPICQEDGISPDTLIPNRYLRIKTKQYANGWLAVEKKIDKTPSEPLSSIPTYLSNLNISTPPRSPVRCSSPAVTTRPSDQAGSAPTTPPPVSCSSLDNGDSDKENTTAEMIGNITEQADTFPEPEEHHEEALKEPMEEEPYPEDLKEEPHHHHHHSPEHPLAEPPIETEVKQRKSKKKKKRKSSRHESEEEKEGKEGRKKKDRKHSHKSQEGKEKELLRDVHSSLLLETKEVEEPEDVWLADKTQQDTLRRSRSRSRSRDRERERDRDRDRDRGEGEVSNSRYDILQFDPRVPPPTTAFVQSSKEPFFQVPPFVSSVPPSHPVQVAPATSQYHLFPPGVPPPVYIKPPGIYQPPHVMPFEAIDDPLTLFNKHLQEKDEQRARRARKSRSRTPRSRSPPPHRYHSRGRSARRSWTRSRSRSPSRSLSRNRMIGPGARSPHSPLRPRWSRSPGPRGQSTYHSQRSPSFTRERSLSNHSLSLSRTPSPSLRIKSSPLQVRPLLPVKPRSPVRPHMDFSGPRDFDRYSSTTLPTEEYSSSYPPPGGSWDPHAWFNKSSHDNFHGEFIDGRGRGTRARRGREQRGGMRQQADDFPYDQHGARYPFDRSQPPSEEPRRLSNPLPHWERDMHYDYDKDANPWTDRGPRLPLEPERRFYDQMHDIPREYEDARMRRDRADNLRRHGEPSGRKGMEEEWSRYPEMDRKKFDEEENRRRNFKPHGDFDDPHRPPDAERFDEFKRFPPRKDEGRRDEGLRKDAEPRRNLDPLRKDKGDARLGRHEGKRQEERESRFKSGSRHRELQEDSVPYSGKLLDSPGKSFRKSPPPRDRRERDKDLDRRDKDGEKRDKDGDKKDDLEKRDKTGERREKDVEKREKDVDKREKDSDRREKEVERKDKDLERRDKDSERRERDIDRKDDHKRDRETGEGGKKEAYRRERDTSDRRHKESDKRSRDSDRRERDGEKREVDRRDSQKRERDHDRREKTDGERHGKDDSKKERESRRERDGERSHTSRWDRPDAKSEREKEERGRSDRHKGNSQEKEDRGRSNEKEEKRKRQKEDKLEAHSRKESGKDTKDDDGKSEKRKHDRKKKKKEKRRASQASTEPSQAELSADEADDKKKRKKRDKKKKVKGHYSDAKKDTEEPEDDPENTSTLLTQMEPVDTSLTGESGATKPTTAENPELPLSSEAAPESDSVSEKVCSPLPLPQLSKWERDEEASHSPNTPAEKSEPEEERKVTVDILKRAENALFSGRGLACRKVYLEAQKQRDEERSPTPDWDRAELREAKRRGPSIQITISSKTESQIGRPQRGRADASSPERPEERKGGSSRSRRHTDTESKSEKHSSRSDKAPSSPYDSQDTPRSRGKSEKEDTPHAEPEKEKEKESVPSRSTTPQDTEQDVITPAEKLDTLGEAQKPEPEKETTADPIPAQPVTHTKEEEEEEEPRGLKRQSSEEITEAKRVKVKTDTEASPSTHQALPDADADAEPSLPSPTNAEAVVSTVEASISIVCPAPEPSTAHTQHVTPECSSAASPPHLPTPARQDFPVAADVAPVKEKIDEGGSVVVGVPVSPGEESTGVREEYTCQHSKDLATREEEEEEEEDHDSEGKRRRYSPIRVPSPTPSKHHKEGKAKDKTKKRKKRKRSLSISSSNSSTSLSSSSSSSSSSSEDEEVVRKKRRKKKKKKAVNSDSSEAETKSKHKKRKKDKKKKKKKEKRKKSEKQK